MAWLHLKPISALILLTGGISLAVSATEIYGDADKAAPIATKICASCHAPDGNSPSSELPKLAGLPPKYLLAQLKAFKRGHRENEDMAPIVAKLSEDDMVNLAIYFAGQNPFPGDISKPDLLEEGKRVYQGENVKGDGLSCSDCHEENGHGSDKFPRLAGQHAEYILKQIKGFASLHRKTPEVGMLKAVRHLSPREAEAVAQYLASLK